MEKSQNFEAMEKLRLEVKNCRKCDLWRHRRNPVLGDGNINASIVFIGEAPGYWEDVKGLPFVGAAGKLLDEILGKAGIKRSEVYITNIVKCRPPENRDPNEREIEACHTYLDRQLNLIKPEIIVTLGRHSTSYIFSKAGIKFTSISEVQGKIYRAKFLGMNVYVIASYHPAAALYNIKLRGEIEKAIKLINEVKSELEKH
ncbi:MAG: type-4 uracil-DNA glycosylase [Candidatus Methanomethylicia archaeon]